MVKIVNSKETDVTVFVTNANVSTFGEWWLLISFDGEIVARCLETLNNFNFVLPIKNIDNVSCLLVKKEDDCYEVAQAQFGHKNLCGNLRRNMRQSIAEATTSTPYEQFVATTENFYQGVDVQRLTAEANNRYKSVADYSTAFEKFYATGAETDYYQSVKKEIGKVFLEFPPYYPLIRKYSQSFFVRIDFPTSDKYFVLGVLQQNGIVRYICYGLPAEQEGFSDKDFVFVDSKPTGFWMLFQDAQTGQITTLGETV